MTATDPERRSTRGRSRLPALLVVAAPEEATDPSVARWATREATLRHASVVVVATRHTPSSARRQAFRAVVSTIRALSPDVVVFGIPPIDLPELVQLSKGFDRTVLSSRTALACRFDRELTGSLAAWSALYPAVEVSRTVIEDQFAAGQLLALTEDAQLLVLGRSARGPRLVGTVRGATGTG
jgi:hypothetical protein